MTRLSRYGSRPKYRHIWHFSLALLMCRGPETVFVPPILKYDIGVAFFYLFQLVHFEFQVAIGLRKSQKAATPITWQKYLPLMLIYRALG